jgi:ribonucleoside-diphosphate reductase alpha chain
MYAATPFRAHRRVPPVTRRSVTHKFAIGGREAYLTVGLDEADRPGEVFLKISKDGSTAAGLAHGFCRALSLALQYGLSLEAAVDRFRGTRFEPSGPTTNPDIPHADSVLDYVARYLDLHFVD